MGKPIRSFGVLHLPFSSEVNAETMPELVGGPRKASLDSRSAALVVDSGSQNEDCLVSLNRCSDDVPIEAMTSPVCVRMNVECKHSCKWRNASQSPSFKVVALVAFRFWINIGAIFAEETMKFRRYEKLEGCSSCHFSRVHQVAQDIVDL